MPTGIVKALNWCTVVSIDMTITPQPHWYTIMPMVTHTVLTRHPVVWNEIFIQLQLTFQATSKYMYLPVFTLTTSVDQTVKLTLQYSQYPHTDPFAYSTFSSSTVTLSCSLQWENEKQMKNTVRHKTTDTLKASIPTELKWPMTAQHMCKFCNPLPDFTTKRK